MGEGRLTGRKGRVCCVARRAPDEAGRRIEDHWPLCLCVDSKRGRRFFFVMLVLSQRRCRRSHFCFCVFVFFFFCFLDLGSRVESHVIVNVSKSGGGKGREGKGREGEERKGKERKKGCLCLDWMNDEGANSSLFVLPLSFFVVAEGDVLF